MDERQAYQSYQPPEPPAELVDQIVEAVEQAQQAERPRRWPLLVGAVAAVILAGLVLLTIPRGDPTHRRQAGATAERATLGERAEALLAPRAAIAWRLSGQGTGRAVRVRQEAGSVTYHVRRGARAFVVQTPVGAIEVLGTRFSVAFVAGKQRTKEPKMSNRSKGLIGLAGLAAVVVTVYQGRVLLSSNDAKAEARAGERGTLSPDRPPRVQRGADKPSEPATAAPEPKRSGARRLASAEARRELLKLIARARERREATLPEAKAAVGSGGSSTTAPATGRLSKDYIRSVIGDAKPMLADCYKLARHTAPELAGKLKVKFTIVGEPEVGGVVESVEIGEDGALSKHPTMRECIEQTMLSLQFDEPEDGGRLVVTYPFRFALAKPKK